MKIVFADDEYLVRLGLMNTFQELYGDSHQLYEAKNGLELIQLTKNEAPDVAFIDIKMPKMNGLQALDEIRRLSPETHCYILSGYAEFSYAQSAMALGADGYLLKPVSSATLHKALEKTRALLRDEWKRKNAAFSNLLYDLLISHSEKSFLAENLRGSGPYYLILAYADGNTDRLRELRDLFFAHWDSPEKGRFAICYPFPDCVCCLTDSAESFAQLKQNSRESLEQDFYLFFAECLTLSDVAGMAHSIDERAILRIAKALPVCSLDLLSGSRTLQVFCRCVYQAALALRQKNRLSFEAWLDRLDTVNLKLIDPKDISMDAVHTHLPQLEPANSVKEIRSLLHALGEQQFAQGSPNANSIAEEVRKCIDKNYALDIGTAVIAHMFDITPNYLSYIFKKEFGIGLNRYLTTVRMRKAQEMLSTTNLPVFAVAEAVGYTNPGYFSKVFQKTYGMLPSECTQDKT